VTVSPSRLPGPFYLSYRLRAAIVLQSFSNDSPIPVDFLLVHARVGGAAIAARRGRDARRATGQPRENTWVHKAGRKGTAHGGATPQPPQPTPQPQGAGGPPGAGSRHSSNSTSPASARNSIAARRGPARGIRHCSRCRSGGRKSPAEAVAEPTTANANDIRNKRKPNACRRVIVVGGAGGRRSKREVAYEDYRPPRVRTSADPRPCAIVRTGKVLTA